MADDLQPVPIPIRRRQTQVSPPKAFEAAAPAPGSAVHLHELKRMCCKLLEEIHTQGVPYLQEAPLSLQYFTTMKTQLDSLATRLQISAIPVEPDPPSTIPHQSQRASFPVQNAKPPSPPLTPPNGFAKLAPQQSRPALQCRQTTKPYGAPVTSRARQAYNRGMQSGSLDLAETFTVTHDEDHKWVLYYGRKKQRKAPFKWFFHEADQRALADWRRRFENARKEDALRGGQWAQDRVGAAFEHAHPVIYHSGRYLRLGKYADPERKERGYRLATEK